MQIGSDTLIINSIPNKWLTILLALSLALLSGCVSFSTLRTGLFSVAGSPPPVVRVRLTDLDSTVTIRSTGRMIIRIADRESRQLTSFSTIEPLTIHISERGLDVVTEQGVQLASAVPGLVVETVRDTARLLIGRIPYDGALLIGYYAGEPQLINRINLERYLTGVLTPELGERKAEEFEAVRAQAVASRTYALSRLGQYESAPYDLKNDVSDQVYVGRSQPRSWVDQAVASTRGEVLVHNGQMIDAYYHSTCGGYTDAVEDVWNSEARSYLQARTDDTFCVWSKYSEWVEHFDYEVLLNNLRAYRDRLNISQPASFDVITDIRFAEITPGGRHRTMIVVTPNGDWQVRTDQIRWALGRPSRPEGILPSNRFVMELARDSAGRITSAEVRGGGYGHGTGMCQCGMIGRARAGIGYREILTAYYSEVAITAVF